MLIARNAGKIACFCNFRGNPPTSEGAAHTWVDKNMMAKKTGGGWAMLGGDGQKQIGGGSWIDVCEKMMYMMLKKLEGV